METDKVLRHTGLSEKQIAVYAALLKLGEASMTELARAGHLKRSTAYLVVEELLVGGLIAETTKGKRMMYSAVHPRRLLDLARFRERQIEEALPELTALYNAPKEKPRIQVFEGVEGMRALYRELYQSLNKREEALWFTRIGALREYMPEALTEYKKMLRRLRHPRIRELNYGDEEGKKWLIEMKRVRGRNHFIRALPTDYEFGFTDNLIFGNKLVIFSLKEHVFVTVIESEEIAKTYRALFEWAWKQGREGGN